MVDKPSTFRWNYFEILLVNQVQVSQIWSTFVIPSRIEVEMQICVNYIQLHKEGLVNTWVIKCFWGSSSTHAILIMYALCVYMCPKLIILLCKINSRWCNFTSKTQGERCCYVWRFFFFYILMPVPLCKLFELFTCKLLLRYGNEVSGTKLFWWKSPLHWVLTVELSKYHPFALLVSGVVQWQSLWRCDRLFLKCI